jgi:coenzyme F420-reducing hydrogenase beta subunit
LLLDAAAWDKLAGIDQTAKPAPDKGYILCYVLGRDDAAWAHVEATRAALGLRVKVVPVFGDDREARYETAADAGPREFVELIKNASFVCTDSFHGMAFSVIYGKDFYVYERFSKKSAINQNSRVYNLLDLLELRHRLIPRKHESRVTPGAIDWARVKTALDAMRKSSLEYLSGALKAATETESAAMSSPPTAACCGCGACASACPRGAIDIDMDELGFYSAGLDTNLCVSCGKCEKTCPMRNPKLPVHVRDGRTFSYKSGDTAQLLRSSSGGAAYELAKTAVNAGQAVFGCEYDRAAARARHVMLNPGDAGGLDRITGSKYIQSGFSGVLGEIAASEGAAVFGTPCQIAAAAALIPESKRESFLLVDLICHGVPSYHLFEKYLSYKDKTAGTGPAPEMSFRYKGRGWGEIYLRVAGNGHESITSQKDDLFFKFFENGHCYMPSCYECPFRAASCADIRLGDYWGERFAHDNEGVSILCAYTSRGEKAASALKATGALTAQDIGDYLNVQQTENFSMPFFYYSLIDALRNPNTSLPAAHREFCEPFVPGSDAISKIRAIWAKVRNTNPHLKTH